MKILYITAFPPNKNTAGQNYSRQLLDDLVLSHDIDLIYWNYKGHEIMVNPKINILKSIDIDRKKIRSLNLNTFFPLFSKRYSKDISQYLNLIVNRYDLIYFDFSQVFMYALGIDHPLKIGMSHDVIAQKFSRHRLFKYLLPWIKVSERKCLENLNKIFTFSTKDSNYIRKTYGLQAGIVPFYLEPKIMDFKLDNLKLDDYYVMYGAWNRKENQESLKWLLNCSIKDSKHIKIIGGGLPIDFQRRISLYTNIEYCGFIENPYPVIASSKGLIAPLFNGAGVKVKVIESLALGTPVIGTDVTFEGIENIPFRNMGALINISNNRIECLIDELDTITTNEKISIRNNFLAGYNSTKFKDCLKNLSIFNN